MKKLNYLVEQNTIKVYFTEGEKVLNGTTKLVKDFSKLTGSKAVKGNFNLEANSNLSDMVKSLVTFAEAQNIEIFNLKDNKNINVNLLKEVEEKAAAGKQINILDLVEKKEAPTAPAATHGIIVEEKHTNLITGETKTYKPAPGPAGEIRFSIIQKNLVVIFKNEKGQKIFNNDYNFIEEFIMLTKTFPLMGKFTIRQDQEKIINHLESFAAKHNLILVDKRKPGSENKEIKEAIKKEIKETIKEVKPEATKPEKKEEFKNHGFYVIFENEIKYFTDRTEAFHLVKTIKRDQINLGKNILVDYVSAKGKKTTIYNKTIEAPAAAAAEKKEVTKEEKDQDKKFKDQIKKFTDIMAIDQINSGSISEFLMEIIERVAAGNYHGINNRLILIATLFINKIDLKYLDNMHTFAGWKNRGYQVKKGEKATIKTSLWIKKDIKKKKEEEAPEAPEAGEEKTYTQFYLKVSNLFTIDQVKEKEEKQGA